MPSPRSIITIAVVSGLTFLAIEHFRQTRPMSGAGGSRLKGVA